MTHAAKKPTQSPNEEGYAFKNDVTVRPARLADVHDIRRLFVLNRHDTSLFEQTEKQIRLAISSMVVAESAARQSEMKKPVAEGLNAEGTGEEEKTNTQSARLVGVASLVPHGPGNAELRGVAVDPGAQGHGVGTALVDHILQDAQAREISFLWLGTEKVDYFRRFCFQPISRWDLPLSILLRKLWLVFGTPIDRWAPALFGRHVIMRYGHTD